MKLTDTEMLDHIASYDFGVYHIPTGYAIADPLADDEGWYLEGHNLKELYLYWLDNLEGADSSKDPILTAMRRREAKKCLTKTEK